MTTRLNKFIAQAQGIARREADTLIENSKVRVNNAPARLGQHVSASDDVQIGENHLKIADYRYILFHKPAGYVCSRKQQGDSPTIYSLLPPDCVSLKPVGRLDKDSSGLLLLTNDGDFAHRLTHPQFHKQKSYEVSLDHALAVGDEKAMKSGIELNDGKSQLALEKMQESGRKHWRISMHEGRNRQIRRTFGSRGYEVVRLHRIAFGDFSLAKYPLEAGTWQELSPQTHLL